VRKGEVYINRDQVVWLKSSTWKIIVNSDNIVVDSQMSGVSILRTGKDIFPSLQAENLQQDLVIPK
jgi:L-ascorbate metabolism protein UlaG (beta-lactamase superfamily)